METDDISSLPSTSKSTEALMATRPEVIIAPVVLAPLPAGRTAAIQ